MFNKSIAYRLSVFISLAVVGVFMAFIIIIFIYNQNIVKKSITSMANNLSFEAASLVHHQLITTQEVSSNISDQILYYAEHGNVDMILSAVMEKYSYLNAIYASIDSIEELPLINNHNFLISRETDSAIFSQGKEKFFHCENEKEIYKELELNNVPQWSEVYMCDSNQMISYYYPIKLNIGDEISKKVGSLITELSLKSLNDSINNMEIDGGGFAFLVNKEGTFITHPNQDWIFERNIFSISKKSYDIDKLDISLIFDNKLSGSIIGYPEYLNYEKCWVHYSPIVETGWYLLILVPYDKLYSPLYKLVLRMIFFAVIGILIIFFIVTYISNKQIQPLSKVTTQLSNFSRLSGEEELKTLDEVKIVSESLDSIKNWFENYKLDQYQEKKLSKQQKQDLQEASAIQMSLINNDFTEFANRDDIDMYAVYNPARIVSGDLFDFFFIDNENLFFSIGDVSGKGVSAAFFMSVAQTIIKANAKLKDPMKIVKKVNDELTTDNQHQFFLTLFLGIFNLKSGKLSYCNAAHTSTNIVKPNGEIVELNKSHGMPLGIYSNKQYSCESVTLEEGDTIWLYTDGVTEMLNEEKEQFGKIRMNQELKQHSGETPRKMIESMEIALANFKGNAAQSDDVTMMAINCKSIKKA